MTTGIPYCDRPARSLAVSLLAGATGGGTGLVAGLGLAQVALLAGGLALAGELGLLGLARFRDGSEAPTMAPRHAD